MATRYKRITDASDSEFETLAFYIDREGWMCLCDGEDVAVSALKDLLQHIKAEIRRRMH
jgi:hypothetical protein